MFMNQSERQANGKWNSTFVRNNIFKKKTLSVNFWCFIEGVDNPDASATACLRSPTCELKGHEGKLILKFIYVITVLLFSWSATSCHCLTEAAFVLACENIRFSTLLAAGNVLRGGTSAIHRQKFHMDEVKSVRNPVRRADWSTK